MSLRYRPALQTVSNACLKSTKQQNSFFLLDCDISIKLLRINRLSEEELQKKRWEDNIKEWTGMGFGDSLRAAEDREGWKGIVAASSVMPRRPPRLRD